MAACWEGSLLRQFTFGHESPQQALARVDGSAPHEGRLPPGQAAFRRRMQALASGRTDTLADIRLDLRHCTDFQCRVIAACRRIRAGQTLSYADLAARAGSPRAARAVGNVMRGNRHPLIVPCHRVIGSHGQLGGYSGPHGLDTKRMLLRREGAGID